jgi:predicted TIM-barrel fold metal-dependent hydrolase
MTIVDAHAHLCRKDYGSLPTLLEQLGEARIDQAVLVPGGMLDVRKMTKYITGEEKAVTMDPPNDLVEAAMNHYPERFFGFYCVDPHRGEPVLAELRAAVGRGFVGLKLAPTVHQFSLTANTVLKLAELCGELNIPFYSHTVYSPGASTKKMAYLAQTFPQTKFIIGHMGFGPADVDAIQYTKAHDNLFLETSQGSYLIIKEALKTLGATKLIFGSEFPMYHPLPALQGIMALKCHESDLENILGRNILRLINKL